MLAGKLERIEEILSEDGSQVDASFVQDGATPLMFAAMTGRIDIAQLLVQHNADINKQVGPFVAGKVRNSPKLTIRLNISSRFFLLSPYPSKLALCYMFVAPKPIP